jgi:hypothetical protein
MEIVRLDHFKENVNLTIQISKSFVQTGKRLTCLFTPLKSMSYYSAFLTNFNPNATGVSTTPNNSAGLVAGIPIAAQTKFIKRLQRDLYRQIMTAHYYTHTPLEAIYTIAAKEIQAAKYTAVSSAGAIGVMQLKPLVVSETFWKAKRYKLMPPAVHYYLMSKLGKSKYKFAMKQDQAYRGAIYREYLFDTQFNLIVGSLLLRVLMHEHTESGKVNWAKVFMAYNQGFYVLTRNFRGGLRSKELRNASVTTLHRLAPPEAKKYLADTLGKNGLLYTVKRII